MMYCLPTDLQQITLVWTCWNHALPACFCLHNTVHQGFKRVAKAYVLKMFYSLSHMHVTHLTSATGSRGSAEHYFLDAKPG